MVPSPTRKISCRFTVTYAGFTGESELLEKLYERGLAQPLVGTDLHAGDGLLMFWIARANRTLADRRVAHRHAPGAAAKSVRAHDRKPVHLRRGELRRDGMVGCVHHRAPGRG